MPTLSKYYILFLLFLLCGMVLLQSNFAPFANQSTGVDSGVFVYTARAIMNGKVLYKEVFDHKGPLIYLINILGLLLLNGNLLGIWLLELASLFITTIFLYRSARLFFDETASFMSIVFALNTIMPLLELGDLTEEYSLCFGAISLFLFLQAMKRNFIFSYKEILAISVCVACSLLLRMNLIALWMSFAIIVSIYLIRANRIKDIVGYTLWALSGLVVVIGPFLIYFYIHRALKDALYANWTFNLMYAHTSLVDALLGIKNTISNTNGTHVGLMVLLYIIVAGIAVVKDREKSMLYIFSIIAFLITLIIGCGLTARTQPHYALSLIPTLVIPSAFLIQKFKMFAGKYYEVVSLIVVLGISIHAYRLQKVFIHLAEEKKSEQLQLVNCIKKNTSGTDVISVIGNNSLLYYLSGRNSCSRFHYQFPLVKIDTNIAHEYYSDLVTQKPRLIVCTGDDLSLLPSYFTAFIDKNYTRIMFEGVQNYRIYKHN